MHNILKEIVARKKQDLVTLKKGMPPMPGYKPTPALRDFKKAILSSGDVAIISEVKLASPTIASLGAADEILQRVVAYEKAGANAISFITEKHYFAGDISFIPKIKETVSIPVLQKDFVIDEYQIYEAKQAGSDALLLIAKLVDKERLQTFVLLCQELGIEPIVEINDEEDLEKAISTKTNIIAVNARDLETFVIDVERACVLLKKIPDTFIKLGFSGIHSNHEVKKYKDAGVKGVLVGTELMRSENVEEFITNLLL